MAELSGNQVSYRNQATGGPVTSSSRFDGLNQRVGASTHPLLSCTVDPLRIPERYALIVATIFFIWGTRHRRAQLCHFMSILVGIVEHQQGRENFT